MGCKNGVCTHRRQRTPPPGFIRPWCDFVTAKLGEREFVHTCQRCGFVRVVATEKLGRRCDVLIPNKELK